MKRLAHRGLVLTALAAALCLFCEGWGETGDVHAAAKNDCNLFRGCGRETLRGLEKD